MNLVETTVADAGKEKKAGEPSATSGSRSSTAYAGQEQPDPASARTLQSAVAFLEKMKPRIMEELKGQDLRVGLKLMDIMRPDRGDLTQAHVMWVGPSYEDENAKTLKRACGTYVATDRRKNGAD